MVQQPRPSTPGGPYLQAALFCDQVIQGQDGVLTLVRVIDRIIRRTRLPQAPEDMQAFNQPLTAVIMLKAGQVRGSHRLSIVRVDPAFQRSEGPAQDIYLEGEDERGTNVVMNILMQFEMPGLYWFEVYFDGVFLTKMPFRVVYLRG